MRLYYYVVQRPSRKEPVVEVFRSREELFTALREEIARILMDDEDFRRDYEDQLWDLMGQADAARTVREAETYYRRAVRIVRDYFEDGGDWYVYYFDEMRE